MDNTQKRAEITKELTTARKYLVAVGILMVAMDLLFMYALRPEQYPTDLRNLALCIDAFVLGLFFALAYFVPKKPRFCMIAGLVLFWLIQLANAYDNPKALTQGVIMKILFTMALWKGLQSASKAQSLNRDLERVFE
ncbi:MAG TPA: hypothetical protein VM261_32095 [Kofleriaceae bacterium]|nr:hypothetical protein [Kofleriaceae bacterium]